MAEIVDIGALGVYSQMAGYGFCDAAGTAVPANDARGYAHGCIYRRLNGVDADDAVYINRGNQNQANFDALVTGGNSGVDLIAETIHRGYYGRRRIYRQLPALRRKSFRGGHDGDGVRRRRLSV